MTLHIYFDHECPKCGTHYIAFEESVFCPKCGAPPKQVFDIVEQAIKAAIYHLEVYRSIRPPIYLISTLADSYIWLSLEALAMFEENPTIDVEGLARGYTEKVDLQGQEFLREHVQAFLLAVLCKWKEERKKYLHLLEERRKEKKRQQKRLVERIKTLNLADLKFPSNN